MTRILDLDLLSPLAQSQQVQRWPRSPEEQELTSALDTLFRMMDQHRRQAQMEIEYNRAMLRGNTLVARNVLTGSVVYLALSEDSARRRGMRENRLRPTHRALVGKHTSIIPAMRTTAASMDESDIMAAEIADQYLKFFAHKEGERALYVAQHNRLCCDGTGIFSLYWDKNAGRKRAWCQEESCGYVGDEAEIGEPCPACQAEMDQASDQQFQQQLGEWQQEDMQAKQQGGVSPPPPERAAETAMPLEGVNEGDLRLRVEDTLDFFPEPGVAKIEDMRYFCFRRAMPITEVRRMFPAMAPYITEESGIIWQRTLDPESGDLVGLQPPGYCYLYEWHFAATAANPKGRVLFVCNQIVLNQQPGVPVTFGEEGLYSILGRHPVYEMRWTTLEGQFWGEGFIVQAAELQHERNELLTQLRDHRRFTLNPVLLTPIGSKVSKTDVHQARPGEVITYDVMKGGPNGTKWLETPDLAQYVYQEAERVKLAIQEQASVTPQELGQSQGDPSGRYAAILEAQNSEAIRPISVPNTEIWRIIHRDILIAAHALLPDDYIIGVVGSSRPRTYEWSAMNLKPGWDVELYEADSLSTNPALRLQQCKDLLAVGFFTDPATGLPDMTRFAKMAGIKEPFMEPELEANERAYAASLPDLILADAFQGPRPWDSPSICAQELIYWLRGAGRSRSPEDQMKVGNVWMLYAALAAQSVTTIADKRSQPNASQQPPQAPQGAPPPGMGSGATPAAPISTAGDAAAMVHQTDTANEGLARGMAGHES